MGINYIFGVVGVCGGVGLKNVMWRASVNVV